METIEKIYKRLINDVSDESLISDMEEGIAYHYAILKKSILARYTWSGLPLTISDHVLEGMLITEGAIIPIEKKGAIWIQPLNAYGVGVYPDEPPEAIYANPVLGSGHLKIKWYTPDCAVGFDNKSHIAMDCVIRRAAMQLARTESCIDLVLTNNNGTQPIVAKNKNVADAVMKIFDARKKGKAIVPVSEEIEDILGQSWQILEGNRNPAIPDILSLITLYNNQLRQFYRKFGINISKDKTQAILSDETEMDNEVLLYTLDEGLQCRREWADAMNNKYELNITVEINENLKPIIKEEIENAEADEEAENDEDSNEDNEDNNEE